MTQRDYIIDLTKEFAKFIALLMGWIDNKHFEEAEQQTNAFLTKHFNLTTVFTFDEVKAQFDNGLIDLEGLKGLLDIAIHFGKMYEPIDSEISEKHFDKALKIIELIEKKSDVFDMSLRQKRQEIKCGKGL
jgi:hypothetical protein